VFIVLTGHPHKAQALKLAEKGGSCRQQPIPIRSDPHFSSTKGIYAFDVVEFRPNEGQFQTFRLNVELSCANPTLDFSHIFDRHHMQNPWFCFLVFSGRYPPPYGGTVEPCLVCLALGSDWHQLQTLSVPEVGVHTVVSANVIQTV